MLVRKKFKITYHGVVQLSRDNLVYLYGNDDTNYQDDQADRNRREQLKFSISHFSAFFSFFNFVIEDENPHDPTYKLPS